MSGQAGLNGLLRLFPGEYVSVKNFIVENYEKLNEIRVRVGKRIGMVCDDCRMNIDLFCDKHLIKSILENATHYSVYAYQEDVKQGFITVEGGHRIGICGEVILENENIKSFQYITFLCIRVAHEIKGCSSEIVKWLKNYLEGIKENVLIISPPGIGKTTFLRDMIREVSNEGVNVCVIDERSEIGACFNGIPQNDLGDNTDCMDHCCKSNGMLMAVRSMCPEIIAVDEIGNSKDIEAIKYILSCGIKLYATIHGNSLKDVLSRDGMSDLFNNGFFDKYILLSKNNEGRSIKCLSYLEGE